MLRKYRNLQMGDIGQSPDAEKLLNASKNSSENIIREMGTSTCGLSTCETERRLKQFGMNVISHEKTDSIVKRLMNAFVNPFTALLLVIAVISLGTDVIFSAEKNPRSVLLICAMVILSGVLRFVQEGKSNQAAARLKELVHTKVRVARAEAGIIEVPLTSIVPGDVIHISAGDMIPADVRLIESKDLFINQSTLTGESEPVEKLHDSSNGFCPAITDLPNIIFMGSYAVSGSGVAVVLATGDLTLFGSMAKEITGKHVITSFDEGINKVSWILVRFISSMVPVVFFINGFTKGNWLEALLFALSVAVGITPEMLPMIVTTNLAKGAVAMARKRTIVKHIDSMQNFGAMDILCADKTGTITQNRVVLEYHYNVNMEDDKQVLCNAFLNSHFQTGLRNLMDVAILAHAEEEGFDSFVQKYIKVDEIPFDFERRRMSVVIQDKATGKTQMITKGAVEEMLSVCSYAECDGRCVQLEEDLLCKIRNAVGRMNRQGMRVIAIAKKDDPPASGEFSCGDEKDMVLMGYLAFLDPPKDSAAAAIQSLSKNGIIVKVLTGDNEAVARCVCKQVGMQTDNLLLGSDIEAMDDAALQQQVVKVNVYAKLTPQQKVRIVRILRSTGHTVGFMGDGINDAAAMRESDVAISVDSAVDIAKESADIILLEKDLKVLNEGVIEGRKTFGNIIKYIKMTASSNFGNMFSIVTASAFLPFLPMLPIQILVLNFIYDISCTAIPWDHMDPEYLKKPRKWDASSISKFMVWIGPTSSVFDVATYIIMFFIICPAICGGPFGAAGVDKVHFISLFNAGWFVESLWSQTLVIHMIRTPQIPFIQSRAAAPVVLLTTASIIVGMLIPYTAFGAVIGMSGMPPMYFPWLIGIIICYMALATFMKTMYIRRYGELL